MPRSRPGLPPIHDTEEPISTRSGPSVGRGRGLAVVDRLTRDPSPARFVARRPSARRKPCDDMDDGTVSVLHTLETMAAHRAFG